MGLPGKRVEAMRAGMTIMVLLNSIMDLILGAANCSGALIRIAGQQRNN
jgi:hypothetical protein